MGDYMVWQSKISTEEANKLISIISENFRTNAMARTAVESQLFPVSAYVGMACQQRYEQSFQYNAIKNVVENGECDPREIGPKCKSPASILNGLAFQAFAMLYLKGRSQVLYDLGGAKYETEEKKEETKFLLDFFRNLNPNYRNDKLLLVDQSEDHNMRILDPEMIESLRGDMFKPTEVQIKRFRRIVAQIMNYGFLDKCECRMGIFEHGPYKLDTGESLIFKEFQFRLNKIRGCPVSNLVIAYSVKDMNALKFNDWGTLFADPPNFTNNITEMGLWKHEFLLPSKIEYPNKMGKNIPVSWETFEKVGEYSTSALKKLYVRVAKWDFDKRCLSGTSLYLASVAIYNLYAKKSLPMLKLGITDKTRSYIPIFTNYELGLHPSTERFDRTDKEREEDPILYHIYE